MAVLEKEVVTITPEQEEFARKVTSYLGKNPNVSNGVEEQLFTARSLALATRKKEEITVTESEKESVAQWLKKYYHSFSNNVVALAILVAAVPVGMNVVDFGNSTSPKTMISSMMDDEDYYLENTYHMEADGFDEDYLKEMGFI